MRPEPAIKRVKQHLSLVVGGKILLFDQAAAEREDGNQDLDGGPPRRRQTRAEWLKREILPHATSIRRRLLRKYPALDVDDVLQASYLRLMAAEQVLCGKEGKHYLYLVAKSVIVDQARHNRVRKAAGLEPVDIDEISSAADEPTADEIIDSRRALQRFYDELGRLPPVQQRVIELRRIEGLGARATAARLARSVSSVEKYQLCAMRRLAAAMDRL